MFIDTYTRDSMENSICILLSITSERLYDEMNRIGRIAGDDYDVRRKEMGVFVGEHLSKELPNEILLFHLSRRLNGTEDDTVGRNLADLLTTDNTFSAMLKKFQIEFYKGTEHIEALYRGNLVNWEKCWKGNSSYMKSRLGYFKGREDFCFNGFAFKDLLYKNNYARSLFETPEFVNRLIECLGCSELGHYYMDQSTYYCYEYKIPFDRVMFDGHDSYSVDLKQRYLIHCIIERLNDYANTNIRYMYDHDNPILRLADDDTLPDNYCVKKEKITVDMLR